MRRSKLIIPLALMGITLACVVWWSLNQFTSGDEASLNFSCRGSDPDWRLNFEDDLMQFNETMAPDAKVVNTKGRGVRFQGRSSKQGAVFIPKSGTFPRAYVQLVDECPESLGEGDYTYTVVYDNGEKSYLGCCRAR